MPTPMPGAEAHDDVRRYLRVLGANQTTPLFWTTFDDKRQRRDLGYTANAALEQIQPRLEYLNAEGAGVFVCVGRVRGTERLRQNVQAVDVLVLDLDGARLPATFGYLPTPHLIVETSPARWHCYWMVDNIPLDAFEIMQRKLAIQFHGDRSVSFLEQIIRVPGFLHHKREPFRSRITWDQVNAERCCFIDIASVLKDIDLLSLADKGPVWIRDRSTNAIIDDRFLSHVVWSEVLKLDTDDPAEIAERAWRWCKTKIDPARLGQRCTLELALFTAREAMRTMTTGQTV